MMLRRVLLLASSILLTGCAGSKIVARKRERAAGYAELPAAQQQLVNGGRIDAGMSTNAVYVAWGNPATTVAATAPGTFTWIYGCRECRPTATGNIAKKLEPPLFWNVEDVLQPRAGNILRPNNL